MAKKYHYDDFHREMSRTECSNLLQKLGKEGYRIISLESKRADFGPGRAYHFVVEYPTKVDEKSLKDLIESVIVRDDW